MLYPARYTVRMHNEVSQAINGARKLLITMRKIFDTRVQEAAGKLGEEAEGKLETYPDLNFVRS
jgi:hypothetical protein